MPNQTIPIYHWLDRSIHTSRRDIFDDEENERVNSIDWFPLREEFDASKNPLKEILDLHLK